MHLVSKAGILAMVEVAKPSCRPYSDQTPLARLSSEASISAIVGPM